MELNAVFYLNKSLVLLPFHESLGRKRVCLPQERRLEVGTCGWELFSLILIDIISQPRSMILFWFENHASRSIMFKKESTI